MSESFRSKPELVREAIESKNSNRLRAAGRKGGLASAKSREMESILKEIRKQEELADAIQHEIDMQGGDPIEEEKDEDSNPS